MSAVRLTTPKPTTARHGDSAGRPRVTLAVAGPGAVPPVSLTGSSCWSVSGRAGRGPAVTLRLLRACHPGEATGGRGARSLGSARGARTGPLPLHGPGRRGRGPASSAPRDPLARRPRGRGLVPGDGPRRAA